MAAKLLSNFTEGDYEILGDGKIKLIKEPQVKFTVSSKYEFLS